MRVAYLLRASTTMATSSAFCVLMAPSNVSTISVGDSNVSGVLEVRTYPRRRSRLRHIARRGVNDQWAKKRLTKDSDVVARRDLCLCERLIGCLFGLMTRNAARIAAVSCCPCSTAVGSPVLSQQSRIWAIVYAASFQDNSVCPTMEWKSGRRSSGPFLQRHSSAALLRADQVGASIRRSSAKVSGPSVESVISFSAIS